MDHYDIIKLLSSEGKEHEALMERARSIRDNAVGDKVYMRALIEFSNICANDCHYCGIRKSIEVRRYKLAIPQLMEVAAHAYEKGYKSFVLQSGEQRSSSFTRYVTEILTAIKQSYPDTSITLSVGEQDRGSYKAFREAGADRYLLRIETSDPSFYGSLHPRSMSFLDRKQCLIWLRELGFQVGTGVMIGLPGQTTEMLAADLEFIRDMDIDMVGMGPYVRHKDTPMNSLDILPDSDRVRLALNMIAVLRIMMPDINIASATALQALDPVGREKGLLAGANVVMPLFTPAEVRKGYQLYDGKPCLEDGSCVGCIDRRIGSVGLKSSHEAGHSMHYMKRMED